jgi:hypothetical protein
MSIPIADLNTVLPVRARRVVYCIYGILGVAVSATQVGYAAVPDGVQPIWLTVTVAVVAFLAAPVTALAVTNTRNQADDYDQQTQLARRDPTDVAVHANTTPEEYAE